MSFVSSSSSASTTPEINFYSRATSATRAYCATHKDLGIDQEQVQRCLEKISSFVTSAFPGELMLKKKHCSGIVPRTTYVKIDADLVKIWIVGSRVLGVGTSKRVKGAIQISYCRSTREISIAESAFCIFRDKEKALLERSLEESLIGVPNIIRSLAHTDFTVAKKASAAGGAGSDRTLETTKYYNIKPRALIGDMYEFFNPRTKLPDGMSKTRASLIALTLAAQTLAALHKRRCFFSDMKPENILCTGPNKEGGIGWGIGDIGSVISQERFVTEKKSTFTACYTSKEYFEFRRRRTELADKINLDAVDTWTLATTLLHVLNEDYFFYVFLQTNPQVLFKRFEGGDRLTEESIPWDPFEDAIISLKGFNICQAIEALNGLHPIPRADYLRKSMGEDKFLQMQRSLAFLKADIGDFAMDRLQHLLIRMLDINPSTRISMEEVYEALKDITLEFELERSGLPKPDVS